MSSRRGHGLVAADAVVVACWLAGVTTKLLLLMLQRQHPSIVSTLAWTFAHSRVFTSSWWNTVDGRLLQLPVPSFVFAGADLDGVTMWQLDGERRRCRSLPRKNGQQRSARHIIYNCARVTLVNHPIRVEWITDACPLHLASKVYEQNTAKLSDCDTVFENSKTGYSKITNCSWAWTF